MINELITELLLSQINLKLKHKKYYKVARVEHRSDQIQLIYSSNSEYWVLADILTDNAIHIYAYKRGMFIPPPPASYELADPESIQKAIDKIQQIVEHKEANFDTFDPDNLILIN